MRVAEHVPLRRKSSTVRSSSRPSVVVPLPLLGANDVAAGRSERRLLDGEVLERRLLSAPPRSQPALHGKGAGSQVRRDRNGDQQGGIRALARTNGKSRFDLAARAGAPAAM
jgi:hypothetical protein